MLYKKILGGYGMKRGYIDKWKDIKSCKNLLFFAQLINELLFDYSIPSNRMSTLNSHYLCFDAFMAIEDIDNNGVPEGTIKPIVEELYDSLKKDVLFTLIGEAPLKYFVKYQNDKYRYTSNVRELSYDEIKKIVRALYQKYFSKSWYYAHLVDEITKIVYSNNEQEQKILFRLTKSLLTELVNMGYHSNYIYQQMKRNFYNKNIFIDSPQKINDFFKSFSFEDSKYSVIVIADKTIGNCILNDKWVRLSETCMPKTKDRREIEFLKKKDNEIFLTINLDALDPYMASTQVKNSINTSVAFYRMCDHNYVVNTRDIKCIVYDEQKQYTIIGEDISSVRRVKTPPKESINKKMGDMKSIIKEYNNEYMNYKKIASLLAATSFHSLSLDSSSEKNQLLDLWAIFETILNISNKHTSDRIQQICMYLVPVLKHRYIYSLFAQLANDIKNYSEDQYSKICGNNNKEFDIVKCIFEFVVLEKYSESRQEFLDNCNDFPLLKERIEYYNDMLSTVQGVYTFVEKHSQRVRWQIMRIYRNRNLIIHNGRSMPYLELLIENLHSYVDDFMDYTIHSLINGNNIESMCQELFSKECDWVETLSNKKALMTEEIIDIILSQ